LAPRRERRFEIKRLETGTHFREWLMTAKRSRLDATLATLIFACALAAPAFAQEGQAQEGKQWGDYQANQSIEFGWRGTSVSGNNDVYDTFVNLGQGVRLFNQSLDLRSIDHKGLLFDNLYTSSFGYGGDPNNFSTLRISKNKWYEFSGQFRRDRNLWDYDLLANPLNPATSNPAEILKFSPHSMALTRRMSDFNLMLGPQAPVRLRLGYSHSVNQGPSLTTFHQGAEALLFQEFDATTNDYQIGVDFRMLPRTNISYDQFWNYYKGDTSQSLDNSVLMFQLPDGQMVSLGVSWDTANNSPCRSPIIDFTTNPPTASASCNGFTSYSNSGPVRSSFPTEQLTFQSNYFKNVDMSGRFLYSSADARVVDSDWMFAGYESRTFAVQSTATGPAAVKRVTTSADYAVTFSLTPKFRVVDEFRFSNWRIPGQNQLSTSDLFGLGLGMAPVIFNPASCPAPYTSSACPPHGNSSGADQATTVSSLFLGQDVKLNVLEFEYDFTKRFGGRLGYRYRHRVIDQRDVELSTSTYFPVLASGGPCHGVPNGLSGTCTSSSSSSDSSTVTINEDSLLLGVWARPIDNLRLSYDQELLYADNTFVRIDPRQSQLYKFRGEYRADKWLSMSGTINVLEARNNVSQIDHLEHTRNYGLAVTIAPQERWSIEAGYNYTGVFSQTNICYIFGSGPPPPGIPACPIAGSPVPLEGISIYNNKLNYGFGDVMLKPVPKLALRLGYSIDSVTGNTLILNPNATPGPLNFNYHRPIASIDYELTKGLVARGAWNFYDYDEKDSGDLTGPRSFRGNLVDLSLVYSF
jgi:hypothetical protein